MLRIQMKRNSNILLKTWKKYEKILGTHTFIMKIPNKQKLQKIALNYPSDIGFMNLYEKCNGKPCTVLVNVTTLASDNLLRFRNNLLGKK